MISNSNSTYRGRPPKQKPLAVIAYNNVKIDIDRSDQMVSCANTIRKSIKWYRKLALHLLLGTTTVNALIVYQTATNKNIQINKFREILASEWSNVSSENTVRQPSEENEEGVSPFGDS